eukprot:TRINITY_DN23692_c0_g1_i1.p1 TRINITY_DN23692_c0_g1~~TRINITY_DN23692_c0_g1_i1.p1  ORF type:complete len:288 (+),score=77.76 TRINITY_DN23692_c0_g1_i1:609-1472(+)
MSRLADRGERERERERVLQRSREQINSRRGLASTLPEGRVSYARASEGAAAETSSRYRERDREDTLSVAGTEDMNIDRDPTPRERPSAAASRPSYSSSASLRQSQGAYRVSTADNHNASGLSAYSDAGGDVSRWSIDRVQKWLVQNGMAKYAPLFARNEIDGATLVVLTPADLIDELRIPSLSERKVLMRLIRQVSTGPSEAPAPAVHSGGATLSGGSLSEVSQLLENETAMLQSFVQSESRRMNAALHHDIGAVTAAVAHLQETVDRIVEMLPTAVKPRLIPYPDV